MNQPSLLQIIESSKHDMNSDNFQFMGVQNMDELLKQHIAWESQKFDPAQNIQQDLEAIMDATSVLSIPEETKKMIEFLIEDIIQTMDKYFLGKKEEGK